MLPPTHLNVLDKHGGFTAITKSPRYVKVCYSNGAFKEWNKEWQECNTLWRPGNLLHDPTGQLQEFDEESSYQLNYNTTKAIYKVKGYRFRIVVWFDNITGQRIA